LLFYNKYIFQIKFYIKDITLIFFQLPDFYSTAQTLIKLDCYLWTLQQIIYSSQPLMPALKPLFLQLQSSKLESLRAEIHNYKFTDPQDMELVYEGNSKTEIGEF
jgi:hypothetical protein